MKNVGTVDRILRIIVGAVLIFWAYTNYPDQWWAWIGVVPILTAFAGYCPAYSIIGLKTCRSA
jgi:Protein of unknown function (DUF2892)